MKEDDDDNGDGENEDKVMNGDGFFPSIDGDIRYKPSCYGFHMPCLLGDTVFHYKAFPCSERLLYHWEAGQSNVSGGIKEKLQKRNKPSPASCDLLCIGGLLK